MTNKGNRGLLEMLLLLLTLTKKFCKKKNNISGCPIPGKVYKSIVTADGSTVFDISMKGFSEIKIFELTILKN